MKKFDRKEVVDAYRSYLDRALSVTDNDIVYLFDKLFNMFGPNRETIRVRIMAKLSDLTDTLMLDDQEIKLLKLQVNDTHITKDRIRLCAIVVTA